MSDDEQNHDDADDDKQGREDQINDTRTSDTSSEPPQTRVTVEKVRRGANKRAQPPPTTTTTSAVKSRGAYSAVPTQDVNDTSGGGGADGGDTTSTSTTTSTSKRDQVDQPYDTLDTTVNKETGQPSPYTHNLDMLNPKQSGAIAIVFDLELAIHTLYGAVLFVAGANELFTATWNPDVNGWAGAWAALLGLHVAFLFILLLVVGIQGSGQHRGAVIIYAIHLIAQATIMTLVVAVAFDMQYNTNAAQTDNRLGSLGLVPVLAQNFNLIKWYAILVLFLMTSVVGFASIAFIVLHDRLCCHAKID